MVGRATGDGRAPVGRRGPRHRRRVAGSRRRCGGLLPPGKTTWTLATRVRSSRASDQPAPSVFDGILWSIIGQQINFPFACLLKRRLVDGAGAPLQDKLWAPPTPAAVAALAPAELLPLQFSRQKADYVTQTARLIAEGKLDLEKLRTMSATRAERTLLAIRGLGLWSVNYLMMRRSVFLTACRWATPESRVACTRSSNSRFALASTPRGGCWPCFLPTAALRPPTFGNIINQFRHETILRHLPHARRRFFGGPQCHRRRHRHRVWRL